MSACSAYLFLTVDTFTFTGELNDCTKSNLKSNKKQKNVHPAHTHTRARPFHVFDLVSRNYFRYHVPKVK